jgi:hypothetical protein
VDISPVVENLLAEMWNEYFSTLLDLIMGG